MSENNLTIHEQGALSDIIENGKLGEMLKPLTEEIHLFDTFIAGTSFVKDKSALESLKSGDRLDLCREENKFDSNAIVLYNAQKIKIGYIPEKDNVIFARLMDAGKILCARVSKKEQKGNFTEITIGIYLVDF